MNRFVILLLVGLAMTIGYMVGTEEGRAKRDRLIEALKRRGGTDIEEEIDLIERAAVDMGSAVESQSA
ncbi:MAG: hypothetical protein ACC660_06475 [Acidimicrobiales bacterium]